MAGIKYRARCRTADPLGVAVMRQLREQMEVRALPMREGLLDNCVRSASPMALGPKMPLPCLPSLEQSCSRIGDNALAGRVTRAWLMSYGGRAADNAAALKELLRLESGPTNRELGDRTAELRPNCERQPPCFVAVHGIELTYCDAAATVLRLQTTSRSVSCHPTRPCSGHSKCPRRTRTKPQRPCGSARC